jgi:hypothetical protein
MDGCGCWGGVAGFCHPRSARPDTFTRHRLEPSAATHGTSPPPSASQPTKVQAQPSLPTNPTSSSDGLGKRPAPMVCKGFGTVWGGWYVDALARNLDGVRTLPVPLSISYPRMVTA